MQTLRPIVSADGLGRALPDEMKFKSHRRGHTLQKLSNNASSLSQQFTIAYLLAVSLVPKRSLCTSWQQWRSCLLLSFQLLALVAKCVFVAQIGHAICQQLLQPAPPSASPSASESRPCCLCALSEAFFPEETEREQTRTFQF